MLLIVYHMLSGRSPSTIVALGENVDRPRSPNTVTALGHKVVSLICSKQLLYNYIMDR